MKLTSFSSFQKSSQTTIAFTDSSFAIPASYLPPSSSTYVNGEYDSVRLEVPSFDVDLQSSASTTLSSSTSALGSKVSLGDSLKKVCYQPPDNELL